MQFEGGWKNGGFIINMEKSTYSNLIQEISNDTDFYEHVREFFFLIF